MDMKDKSLILHITKLGLIIILILFMVFHPKEVFAASKTGMDAWLQIVFPALLPFFIGSEILMSFGLVHFMGVLLEPIMRPVFRLPGAASFVVAVGFTSGFPIGSVLTAKLRKDGLCTKSEAEHLMSFTNNASPLFMLGAVAVGMFNNTRIGYLIAGAHYLANLTIGLLERYYHNFDRGKNFNLPSGGHLLKKAIEKIKVANLNEKRAFGKILGDAIYNSIQTLLIIGGFVIVFSVIIKILAISGIISWLGQILSLLLSNFGFPAELCNALASGIWEITLGAKFTSQTSAPLIYQIMAVSFILGWSGVCVHAQVASVVANTDLKMPLFVFSRFLQGVLAAVYIYFLSSPGFRILQDITVPVFKQIIPSLSPTWWQIGLNSSIIFIKINLLLLTFGLLIGIFNETKAIFFRYK